MWTDERLCSPAPCGFIPQADTQFQIPSTLAQPTRTSSHESAWSMPIWLFGITHCTAHKPGSVRSQYVFRCSMIQTAIVAHQPPQKRHVLRYLATTHCQASSVSLADLHLHFASVVNFADTLGGFHARDSQRGRSFAASYLTATDL